MDQEGIRILSYNLHKGGYVIGCVYFLLICQSLLLENFYVGKAWTNKNLYFQLLWLSG